MARSLEYHSVYRISVNDGMLPGSPWANLVEIEVGLAMGTAFGGGISIVRQCKRDRELSAVSIRLLYINMETMSG